MSFLKKFKSKRKSSESGSIGSTLSLKSVGLSKSNIIIPYSVIEKDLSPFLKAIWKNNLNKMRKLMKKNLNFADGAGRTGLHLACAMGNEEIVKELLEGGMIDFMEKIDGEGRTCLFKAVEADSITCVKVLIEKSARMDCKDDLGDSLLHIAVKHKNDDLVDYLLERGCEHSVLNKEGLTPLHVAATLNYTFAIDMLMEYGIDVDQLTSTGKSALILGAESGNYNIIKSLLAKNADLKILDNEGRDAHYYADFHQYHDCSKQLQSQIDYSQNKTTPKRPSPIQMPEFIVSLGSESNAVQDTSKSPLKSILRNQLLQVTHPIQDLKEKNSQDKKADRISIMSDNSWSGDISHYSSDTTLPINKINPLHDISTPSSMPNPSEDSFNVVKSLTRGVSKTQSNKHISDDEESQWTDTEEDNDPKLNQQTPVRQDAVHKIVAESKMNFVDAVKVSDSDWDSDTELKMPKSVDGHQTDSNIEECFNANCLVLNKPVRYDSSETLENSFEYDEEDTELSQTKIPNPNFTEAGHVQLNKPPISPMNKNENLPIIRIEDSDKKIKWAQSSSGDNLSYSSTEHSSRPESLVGSDNLAGEYIKKCSTMESKLRKIESEKNILEQNINMAENSKKKIETEKLKLLKDYQKLEVMFSEQKDELVEIRSRFVISEDLLKTREKELFESKKLNQELVGSRNEIEMKNIALNSKINQLTQEISNLQSELQRSNNTGKDVESLKTQLDNERISLQREKNELTTKIDDIKKELEEFRLVSDSKIMEQKCTIEQQEEQIKELTYVVEENKEEYSNKDEEIEQLKKTIKNLNADLESSNKFATMASKEEQKNKALNEQLKIEEDKVNNMSKEIQILRNQVSEIDQSNKNITREVEKLKTQMTLEKESYSKLVLKSKTFEKQSKDFEQLIEIKAREVKQLNMKCSELDENLTSERNKNENVMEGLSVAINSAFNECSNSEEVLEHLESMRKLVQGYNSNYDNKVLKFSHSYQDIDSSIELSKAKSQIKVLQEQLDNVRRDLKQSKDYIASDEKEMNRIDKIEKIEKENQQFQNDQSKTLRKSQQQFEEENKHLRKSILQEKQRIQQSQDKEKSLSIQLANVMKRNQVMEDVQESLKQMLIKYNKILESEDKITSSFMGSSSHSLDTGDIDVMMFCSKLLQKLSYMNDEMKQRLRKVEMEKIQIEEELLTRDKNQDIVVENSKIILTQQLSELTQMMDNQRNNREKLEKIRDENEFQLRNELYELKQCNMMETNNLNQILSRLEKDREELIQEVRDLSDQLIKERNLKDSLTEQLVNVFKNTNGSVSQLNGCKEFIFPNAINNVSSQWNIPVNNSEVERKQFSTSMSNLSMLRPNGIQDEEIRQRLRNELDRSIAKHLESGKPIRHLNIKDKIRSLNVIKFPNNNVAWKAQ